MEEMKEMQEMEEMEEDSFVKLACSEALQRLGVP